MATTDEKKRLIQLRAQGVSFQKIAVELKKSKTTLIKWARKFEEEIAQARSLELESLFEEYYLNKENRIRTYGEMFIKIREAIDLKGFNDMSTDKLLKYYTQFSTLLKVEYAEYSSMNQKVEERGTEQERLRALSRNY